MRHFYYASFFHSFIISKRELSYNSTKKLIEQKINELISHGEKSDKNEVSKNVHTEIYTKIQVLADTILQKYPNEVIAKEKLIKSLYITGKYDLAKIKGEEFLQTISEDEPILWYMCKIEDSLENFYEEKAYLEKLLTVTNQAAPIQILKRLNRVNSILKKKEDKLQKEQQKQEQIRNLTEEDRQIWLDNIQKVFKDYGNISLEYLNEKLKEAKNYPNYGKSLVSILDMKSMITEDYENELKELENYLDAEYSISKEDYKEISDAIKRLQKYYNIAYSKDSYAHDNYDDYDRY